MLENLAPNLAEEGSPFIKERFQTPKTYFLNRVQEGTGEAVRFWLSGGISTRYADLQKILFNMLLVKACVIYLMENGDDATPTGKEWRAMYVAAFREAACESANRNYFLCD